MGCCSSRIENAGDQSYTDGKKDDIKTYLENAKKEEIKAAFEKGFRLHHLYEKNPNKSFLKFCLETKTCEWIFDTEYFSVSEECLKEAFDKKKIYQVIFEDPKKKTKLLDNYIEGLQTLEIKDQEILKYFADTLPTDDRVKTAFHIPKEEKKPEAKVEEKKVDAK